MVHPHRLYADYEQRVQWPVGLTTLDNDMSAVYNLKICTVSAV